MHCDPGVLVLFAALLAERLVWLIVGIVVGLVLEHYLHLWEKLLGGRAGRWTDSGRR